MKGCGAMSLTGLRIQNYHSRFSAVEPCCAIHSPMGVKAGPGLNSIGAEIEQYSQLIGKSLNSASKGGNPADDGEEERKRKRAKRANEIFRSISKTAGLIPFFFDNFLVWSDYVEGKLNEEDFTERVREEVNIKAASLKN
jgi:hypothetical protein